MKQIIPAIIPESQAHLMDVLRCVRTFTDTVQVDIVDGEFVPFVSWPYVSHESIHDLLSTTSVFHVEVDLMIARPEEVILEYVGVGVSDVVVHLESTQRFTDIVEQKRELCFRLGISINNDSPLSLLTEQIQYADYVQLMGIEHIGSQGQPFDERVLSRIHTLRAAYPTLMISIDGSVNADTIPRLRAAGANRFVSGSAILKSENPITTFNTFEKLAQGEVS